MDIGRRAVSLLALTALLWAGCRSDEAVGAGVDATALDTSGDAPLPALDTAADEDANSAMDRDAASDGPSLDITDSDGADDAPVPDADAAAADGAHDTAADGDAAVDNDAAPDADATADADGPTLPDLPGDLTPLQCAEEPDPCPQTFNCFCGGPGPATNCFCGVACESADDCQDPNRPICCGDTCTSSCECFCD